MAREFPEYEYNLFGINVEIELFIVSITVWVLLRVMGKFLDQSYYESRDTEQDTS